MLLAEILFERSLKYGGNTPSEELGEHAKPVTMKSEKVVNPM